jgi:hypothetical protein
LTPAPGLAVTLTLLGDIAGITGVVVAVVAIVVSVVLWFRGRRRKGVSYRLTTPSVVNVRQEAEDRISIAYDGKPVGDVRLVDLRVTSSGNTEIDAGDFERPFSVPLGEGARVLSVEVAKTHPAELRPEVTVEDSHLTIAPLLLNSGDSFEIVALVSDLSEATSLDGRVAGVTKFENLGSRQAESRSFVLRNGAEFLRLGVPLSVATVVGLGSAVGLWAGEAEHTDSRVVLRQGEALCGDVLRVDSERIVLKLQGSGELRTIATRDTHAIRDNDC